MLVEPPRPRRPWPGWDGALLIALGVAIVAVYLGRGQLGGEHRLLLALGLDVAWLALTAWTRLRGQKYATPADGFRPLVVIPSHNNADQVADVARGCLRHCADVVVLDDGSTDSTAAVAGSVDGVTVLRHGVNRGKGSALSSALLWAQGRDFTHVIAVDADGQHIPDDLPHFLDAARRDPWAIHVGVRTMENAPGKSHFGRSFSNFWVWAETGHRVGDSQSGFRVYPVVPVLSLGLGGGRYEWEVEVLVRALWNGIGVRDVPCEVYYPPAEERVTSFRLFWDNVRISVLNTRLVAERILWPPRWWLRVPEPGADWRGRHLGTLWGWLFFLGMLRLFGRWPTYIAMRGMSLFYLLTSSDHRSGVQGYLRRAQAAGIAVQAGWLSAWRVFYNFAISIIDRFLRLARGKDAFKFEIHGAEEARATLQDSGVIFISAHMGNPELGASELNSYSTDKPVNILQFTAGEDPYVALLQRYTKTRRPPRIISLNAGEDLAAMEAVRALRRGEIVALKGDRIVDDRTATVDLLGSPVRLPTGPWLLAAISGAPIVVFGCFKKDARTYHVEVGKPRTLRFTSRKERDADLHRWTTEFASQMEQWIKAWPHQWYNFHDPWAS
jgi:predicted LPLAT superfamily acyltransferase